MAENTIHYLKDYQAPAYRIKNVELNFLLDESETLVESTLHIDVQQSGTELKLDGRQLSLQSVTIDGQELEATTYSVSEQALVIAPEAIPQQASFVLKTQVKIQPDQNKALEGLYKSHTMLCTQCEAEGFRRITYFLDRPDNLSCFKVRLEGDKQRYPLLLSNGNLVASGDLDDGKHWVEWEDPFPKPSYLFAIVAGDLECLEDHYITSSGRKVALKLYAEKSDIDKCGHAMLSLKNAMAWDEKVYGREYDLDLYQIVAVSHFNMGAMENKGLNVFNTSCVLADQRTTTDAGFQRVEAVVAHEYFHNWSGNRVTCRDWFQLSLKEGFTVFRDAEFSSDMNSRAVKRIEDVELLRNYQFPEDDGPMAHPVRPASYEEINNFYTVTVYEKGAEVVRMQAQMLGAEAFRKATDLYFDKFDGQAVTTDDFVACMQEVSGSNFDQFKRWYSQSGTPRVEASARWCADKKTFVMTMRQNNSPQKDGSETEAFFIPIKYALLDKNTGEECASGIWLLTEDNQEFIVEGISTDVVPSLLREFSAPIRLRYDYSADDLAFLIGNDQDGFARWDASQQLAIRVALSKITQSADSAALSEKWISALRSLLTQDNYDHALMAKMLIVPSMQQIADHLPEYDVDAVFQAREQMYTELADTCSDLLLLLLEQGKGRLVESYQPIAEDIGVRSLLNTALLVLTRLSEDKNKQALFESIVFRFANANNMTDKNAALEAALHSGDFDPSSMLEAYYQEYSSDALVIDSWFSMQARIASPLTLQRCKELIERDDFDWELPNRVRALLGAFALHNPIAFHQSSGEAYRWYAQQIIKLDKINPQIASRLVSAFNSWKRFNKDRQAVMKECLQTILDEKGLSPNVSEIVKKSLA